MDPTVEKAVTLLTGIHCRHFSSKLNSTMSGRYRIYTVKKKWRSCFLRLLQLRLSPTPRIGALAPAEMKMNEDMGVPWPAEILIHEGMGELRLR